MNCLRFILGHDNAGVGYVSAQGDGSLRWGVVDEESKINLNKTNIQTLTNLLMNVLSLNDEDATKAGTVPFGLASIR